jgi:undecaprenyl diphosphate synthase
MSLIKHVAIIMDGNGRWGIKHKKSRNLGHRAGLNSIEAIIEETIKQKINYLTLYTFSTENWKRPKKEIDFLFDLLKKFLIKKLNYLIENKIKIIIMGNKKKFTKTLQKILSESEKKSSKNDILQINLALNYGSKEELINAMKIISKKKKRLMKLI